MDQTDKQIQELRKQIQELRNDLRLETIRLDRIWWKIGLMAGLISVIMGRVFGGGIAEIINPILGW